MINMKKLIIMFGFLVAPFAFTACSDDPADEVKPQKIDTEEVEGTDDEDAQMDR